MPRKRIGRLFDIKEDDHGRQYMEVFLDGIALLRLVLSNRGVEGGLIYPPVNDLQETSVRVATAVVQQAIADRVARRANIPEDIESFVRQRFWHPTYLPFVRGHLR